MSAIILGGGGESEDLDRAVVAGRGEILVGWIEGDALDMTRMVRYGLQLLERIPRPNGDLRV